MKSSVSGLPSIACPFRFFSFFSSICLLRSILYFRWFFLIPAGREIKSLPPAATDRLFLSGLESTDAPATCELVLDMYEYKRNPDIYYVNPEKELNAGIWTLYAGATTLLAARIWSKLRRHGLWYDDFILLVTWVILTANDIIISIEYATGYVDPTWDDRMHILINITSCGTLLGQCLSKTAFAVTLLKLTRGFSHWKICHCILWFCIITMCFYNLAKVSLYQFAPLWKSLTHSITGHRRMGQDLRRTELRCMVQTRFLSVQSGQE